MFPRSPSLSELPTDEGMEAKTAVLMTTCAKFQEAWDPFFILFRKFWPDCPYRLYMATDRGAREDVEVLKQPDNMDRGWSSNLLSSLERMEEDRVILFLEDFLLTAPVDTKTVRHLVRHAYDLDLGCLRVFPCPGPSGEWFGCSSLGSIRLKDEYRVSTQVAIWDRLVLADLLREGETAWQFETNGSERSRICAKAFVSIKRVSEEIAGGPVPYEIGILRGKWRRKVVDIMEANGVPVSGLRMPIKE